jgi:hypothetical protein
MIGGMKMVKLTRASTSDHGYNAVNPKECV